jgi:hypothetical protein
MYPLSLLAAGPTPAQLGLVLLWFCCLLAAGLGLAGMVALLRVILPGVARAADRAASHGRTRNIGLLGLLPIVGVVLLAAGLDRLGSKAAMDILSLVIGLPLLLFVLAGTLGAVPFIGRRVLAGGDDAGVLKQSAAGGIVLALACVTRLVEPLFALLVFLVAGWLLSIGLGALKGAPREPETDVTSD